MTHNIRAIETRYKGYRFRSRLEARWAVFFDALDAEWEYEHEGYVIDGKPYLPDFWLPSLQIHAEVKPRVFTEREFNLAMGVRYGCILLDGTPQLKLYSIGWNWEEQDSYVDFSARMHDNYRYYCSGEDAGRVHIVECFQRGELFYSFGEDATCCDLDAFNRAIAKARGARFEYGEHHASCKRLRPPALIDDDLNI